MLPPDASTRAILSDLHTCKITPNEAVQRLTDAAVERTGCPPSQRAAIESKMRALIANDPLLRTLMRQMGAIGTPSDE